MKHVCETVRSLMERAKAFQRNKAAPVEDRTLSIPIRDLAPAKRLRRDTEYFTSEVHLRQGHRADWQHVDPSLRLFWARFYQKMRRAYGIPLFCVQAYRTPQQQTEYFFEGASQLKGRAAPHPRGCAIDFIHSVYGWNITEAEWDFLIRQAKIVADTMNLDLTFGHDWGWDSAHIELTAWRQHDNLEPGKPVRIMPTLLLKS